MFIYSLKAQSLKFVGAVALSVAVLITLAALVPEGKTADVFAGGQEDGKYVYSGIRTDEDRVKFLAQFGLEVDPVAVETENIRIPDTFDKVYLGYNELQRSQGLDLSKYRNKKATRYTYRVTNCEDYTGEVLANIIVYRDKVIGGDVCSRDVNGFVRTLESNPRI